MIGKNSTDDIYYDRNGLFFSSGICIRRRDGSWEAKPHIGGDSINSAFTKVDGYMAVNEVIKQNLTVCIEGLEIEDLLEPCAEFLTERESWIMDGRFGVSC